MELQCGDIVIINQKKFWLGRLIRWFTQRRGEEQTFADHIGIMVGPCEIVESLTTTKCYTYYYEYDSRMIEVYRCHAITNSGFNNITRCAREYVGRSYGWFHLVGHAFDSVIGKITGEDYFLFRRLTGSDKYPICSWVVAFSYWKGCNLRFGVDPRAATPDDIHDYVKLHTDWDLVYKNF